MRKSVEEHISDIRGVVAYATQKGVNVNVYLEDWSNGIKDSADYVFALMDGLQNTPIERYMLPDTLGVLNPMQVSMYIGQMVARSMNFGLCFMLPMSSTKLKSSTATNSTIAF